MRYLGIAKTERRSYAESVRLLEKKGFRELSTFKKLVSGDKVYRGCEDRTIMAAVIGREPIATAGLKVVGGHTDAPRLDLKPKPLYEKGGYVYFDCHIYGGIKKYQWLTIPLALYGTIVRQDGSKVDVAVGDAPDDPVFMISDILPHLGYDQAKKKRDEFYPAEDLDVFHAGFVEYCAYVVVQRFACCTGFLSSVENCYLFYALRQFSQEVLSGERSVQVYLDHADFFTLLSEVVDDFLQCFAV
jgi:aspartyl aminopeptidase